MARKDRVPNPPKRVQAPQRRHGTTDPAAADRQRKVLYLVAGSGILLLAVVLGIIFVAGGGGGKAEAATIEAAGCTLQSFPALPNKADHSDVPTLDTKPKWNSYPPTSGPHYGQTAILGSYDEPVPLVQSTHSLEHGAIVIHYGKDVPAGEVEKIRDWYSNDPNGLLVAPLADLGKKIALAAWTTKDATPGASSDRGRGYLVECTKFSEKAFDTFVNNHRFKGPERIPAELMTPGS
jgi:hypothetical protein